MADHALPAWEESHDLASPYAGVSPVDRLAVIRDLAGLVSAVQAELCAVVAVAEGDHDYTIDGATGMDAWLMGACGLSRGHARELTRVAAALRDLPAVAGVFASGAVSWDQVRPATRFATPTSDAQIAGDLPGWSVAQVERMARQARPKPDDDERSAHARRGLWWRPDHKRGGCHYRGFLPTDMAAQVNAALTELASKAGPDPDTGVWDPFAVRCADALHALATGETTDTLVVMHVDAAVAAGLAAGNGHVDDPDMAVAATTALRWLCDTKIEYSIDGPDGTTIGIGRASRSVPRWLRRRVLHRDRTCRWPGCSRPIRHNHHMRHWTRDKGPTDASNLIGVCWAHHHLLHHGGWNATGNADGDITLTSPHGRRLTSRRPPMNPETRTAAAHRLGLTPLPGFTDPHDEPDHQITNSDDTDPPPSHGRADRPDDHPRPPGQTTRRHPRTHNAP